MRLLTLILSITTLALFGRALAGLGGFLFGSYDAATSHRMPLWTRMGSDLALILAGITWFVVCRGDPRSRAYATAYSLTGGFINLVTIVIGSQIKGDILYNPGLGYALAIGMVVVMSVMMTIYYVLRRRSERWLRQ